MLKEELLKLFDRRRNIVIIMILIILPLVDLFFVWNEYLADYFFHSEAYTSAPTGSSLLHPCKASFLSASSIHLTPLYNFLK